MQLCAFCDNEGLYRIGAQHSNSSFYVCEDHCKPLTQPTIKCEFTHQELSFILHYLPLDNKAYKKVREYLNG